MTTATFPNHLLLQVFQRLAATFAAVISLFAFSGGAFADDAPADVPAAPAATTNAPPASAEEFDKRYAEEGKTPDAALKLWFDGIFLYHDKATRALGIHILTQTTADFEGSTDWETRSSAATFVTRMRSAGEMHIFRSYAVGTSPDNGYEMSVKDYKLNIMSSGSDQYSEKHAIKLLSSGADNPRIVYLIQNAKTGLWRVQSFSSVYLGVRKPAK